VDAWASAATSARAESEPAVASKSLVALDGGFAAAAKPAAAADPALAMRRGRQPALFTSMGPPQRQQRCPSQQQRPAAVTANLQQRPGLLPVLSVSHAVTERQQADTNRAIADGSYGP
jgi:hypothetical protein